MDTQDMTDRVLFGIGVACMMVALVIGVRTVEVLAQGPGDIAVLYEKASVLNDRVNVVNARVDALAQRMDHLGDRMGNQAETSDHRDDDLDVRLTALEREAMLVRWFAGFWFAAFAGQFAMSLATYRTVRRNGAKPKEASA